MRYTRPLVSDFDPSSRSRLGWRDVGRFPGSSLFDRVAPPGKPAVMTVTNRSQFTLLELRMHGTASYATAPNLLAVPLTINATISHRGSGEYYVTTFRERFAGGPTVALTTETPISLADDHRYQLSVFDTSFRLEER